MKIEPKPTTDTSEKEEFLAKIMEVLRLLYMMVRDNIALKRTL